MQTVGRSGGLSRPRPPGSLVGRWRLRHVRCPRTPPDGGDVPGPGFGLSPPPLPPLQRRDAHRRRDAYSAHLDAGGRMFVTLAGAMSTAELGLSLAEMIRQGQGARHLLHRREPRGGRLQSGRARPLRACAALPRSDAGRRAGAARPAPQPRDRHVHPRRGGDAPHRDGSMLEEWTGAERAASGCSRTSSSTACCVARIARATLPDRPETVWLLRGHGAEPADLRARLGGFDAGQHVRGACASTAT